MNKTQQVLAKANTATLIKAARDLETKGNLNHEEKMTFSWIMGEVLKRSAITFDAVEYKRQTAIFGPVDALLAQIPGALLAAA